MVFIKVRHIILFRSPSIGKLTIFIVYADYIIIMGDDNGKIQKLKVKLAKELEIKDLGALCYFLGIKVVRSKEGIYIAERKFVLDLLKKMECLDASLQKI